MVHAAFTEGAEQGLLGRCLPEQFMGLARMRKVIEPVRLGLGIFLQKRCSACHQRDPAGGSKRRSTCAKTSAAITSGGLVPSSTLQRCGSAFATSRKPSRNRA